MVLTDGQESEVPVSTTAADFAPSIADQKVRSGASGQVAVIAAANTQAANEANSTGARSEPSPRERGRTTRTDARTAPRDEHSNAYAGVNSE